MHTSPHSNPTNLSAEAYTSTLAKTRGLASYTGRLCTTLSNLQTRVAQVGPTHQSKCERKLTYLYIFIYTHEVHFRANLTHLANIPSLVSMPTPTSPPQTVYTNGINVGTVMRATSRLQHHHLAFGGRHFNPSMHTVDGRIIH